jgi:hypothetical protein
VRIQKACEKHKKAIPDHAGNGCFTICAAKKLSTKESRRSFSAPDGSCIQKLAIVHPFYAIYLFLGELLRLCIYFALQCDF